MNSVLAPTGLANVDYKGRGRTGSRLHRQSRGLPGFDATGEMGVVAKSRRLGNLGGLDGTNARRTREHHHAALRVWQIDWIELRQRRQQCATNAFTGGLVGLAYID